MDFRLARVQRVHSQSTAYRRVIITVIQETTQHYLTGVLSKVILALFFLIIIKFFQTTQLVII